MRIRRLCLVVLLTVSSFSFAVAGEEPNQVETAIKKTVQSYSEAFNKGDAKALAEHWTKDGSFVTPSGEELTGKDKLEAAFKAFFDENKGIKLEVTTLAVYPESKDKAIEEGIAVTTRLGAEPEMTRYVASYVKNVGAWKIAKLREIFPIGGSSNYDKLKELEWMIGDWVDKDSEGSLEISCFWSENQNFLVRSFAATIGDLPAFGGKQIIGWDPASKQIRSWVFDSNGGFGEGTWTKKGESWYVDSAITLSTGDKASSINVLTPVDDNSFTWQSTGREVGGEILPNTPKVAVVRAPSTSK